MIVCPRCAKENQGHYKFCLGCGAELPRASKKEAPARSPSAEPAPAAPVADARFDRSMQFAATQQGELAAVAGTSRGGAGSRAAMPAASVGASEAAVVVPPARVPQAGPPVHRCPACSNPVPADFKFCGTCGHRIEPSAGAPVSEPPAVIAQPEATAPASAPAAAPAPSAKRGSLVLINPDGTEGSSFSLSEGSNPIGRSSGRLFASDAFLSPLHATFVVKSDGCTLRDEDSLNGVYVKLIRDRPARLTHGDVFRIGQEILRFETIPAAEAVDGVEIMGSQNPGYLGRICLVLGRDSIGHAHTIAPDGLYIGRERGDVIFPEDGYVSGLHCRIHRDGNAVVLVDIGSSNGTFLRVRGERTVASGELILMGQQLFRLVLDG